MQKLNGFQLKMIMSILMVLDHIYMIPGLLSPMMVGVFHGLTRCVGVWFAYMLVEGFTYTRDKKNYNIRLFLWASIMFAGSTLLNGLYQAKGIEVHNNIFLTLALSALALNVIAYRASENKDNLQENSLSVRIVKFLLVVVVFLFGSVYAEGGMIIIPFVLISYGFRNKKKVRNRLYCLMAGLLFATSFQLYEDWAMTVEMLLYNSDWMFLTVMPFIALYNGERGRSDNFGKYFFYVFYPLHLWVIATIAYLSI